MAQPFLSEIRIFSFSFAPTGWAFCNGQTLAINQNAALFALIGTFYGGNGTTSFQLPNLQGKVGLHMGSTFTIGETGGEASHTVLQNEMPQHNHLVQASGNGPNESTPLNNYWASNTGFKPYASSASETMNAAALGPTGDSQPHQNMSPYLVLNFCIALVGIFPSR